MDQVDVVLDSLHVHFLATQRNGSRHVNILRMRLVELVLALLLLDHLKVISANVVHFLN